MPAPPVLPTLPPALPGEQGRHYPFIRQAIPDCLVQSSAERRQALKHTPAQVPSWYADASQTDKDALKTLLQNRCESLNQLEKTLGKIASAEVFAQPLLEQALKAAGHALDVNRTWLRLYSPAEDAFGVSSGGFKVRTFSLLQAALHNFEAREAKADFFNAASGFITEPDARGHFEQHATTLAIDTFVTVCRQLDLGSRYQAHLKATLYPADTVSQGVLRERYLRYQKDAFLAAALLALLKGDIEAADHALLLRVAAGESPIMLGDKQIWYRTPCLMNLHLGDCLIIDPCVKYRYSDWLIAYIPDDPDHPIKRYATFAEFENALTARLTTGAVDDDSSGGTPVTDYQRFFSRFVAYKDRPYYFRRLTELVVDAPPQPFGAQWVRSEWGRLATRLAFPLLSPLVSIKGEPQPSIRVPITHPEFNINADAINGLWGDVDLWPQRFESLRKRMLADGLAHAIPTADADSAASSRRLQHYLNIGLFGVNLLAMAVPPLGLVMSGVMAGQLLYEMLEGAIELSEGDREAGWAHITDVVENLAALAAGVAVFHFVVSPFIEGLKAVTLPSGATRLWKPDLARYEHLRALPAGAVRDERGLYRVDGSRVLALDDRLFRVRHEPARDRYVIEHPTRPDAYTPRLHTNDAGAWHHELEQPQTWHGATLMRRLGPVVDGFSDTELEQIRQVSDIDEDVLRRMHTESEPVPAVLLDTVRQFRAYQGAVDVAEGIAGGSLPDHLCSYAAALAVELPGWPTGKAIGAFEVGGAEEKTINYGNPEASAQDTLRICRAELMSGELPARIVGFLDAAQLDLLVGRYTARTLEARIAAVQQQLQARAVLMRARLMRSLYADQQPLTDAAIRLVQRDFTSLPTLMVREMLADIPTAQRAALNGATRLPLHIAERARGLQRQVRLIHAYEGLYLDALANQDTEALVLNTLKNLPGWTDNLRVEVREGELQGPLRASFGNLDAGERKVLVRVAEGRYEARNERDEHLHGSDDLYAALQHALPDRHRRALGLPHVGQGAQLKATIIGNALPREQLRSVLQMQAPVRQFFKMPSRLIDGRIGYPLSGRGLFTQEIVIKRRVLALYPAMTDLHLSEYLQGRNLNDDGWLVALEQEYAELDVALTRWTWENNPGRRVFSVRRKISKAIKDAWRNSSAIWDVDLRGVYRGQAIDLQDGRMGAELASLPPLPGNFNHVTGVSLPDIGLTEAGTAFLATFRRLRALDLSGNGLTRLPPVLEHMPYLEHLSLEDNEIVLTPEAVANLALKVRLHVLDLEGNPLGLVPDVSRMAQLKMLLLASTGLTQWPVGIFGRPRPRGFILDLGYNALTEIPDVAPGSDRAQILARTAVSREQVSAQVLARLRLYTESVGLDPERNLPPRGTQDSAHWMAGMSPEQWLAKQPVWDAIEEAPGAEAFFDELRKLSTSSDTEDTEYRKMLTAKVWRMLEAMAADTQLRKRLFQMALAPTTCVDAGAQLFNAMGVEVLLQEARAIPEEPLRTRALLELARGRSRLDELGRIAHARVSELIGQGRVFPLYDLDGHLIPQYDEQGRLRVSIDEVEIHLAYATELAGPLRLPWQSSSMKFPEPDVTPHHLETAYRRIAALEGGEQMRDLISEQPFWADYVRVSYAEDFQAVEDRIEALTDLQVAQREWNADGGLNSQQKQALRDTITTAGQLLGKSTEQVREGQELSNTQYDEEMAGLVVERSSVLTRVTGRLIGRFALPVLAPWTPRLLAQNRK